MVKRLENRNAWQNALRIVSVFIIAVGGYTSTQLSSNFSLDEFALEQQDELENYETYNRLFLKGDELIIVGLKSKTPLTERKQFKDFTVYIASVTPPLIEMEVMLKNQEPEEELE